MDQNTSDRLGARYTRAGLPEIFDQQNTMTNARDITEQSIDNGHTPSPRIEIKIPDPPRIEPGPLSWKTKISSILNTIIENKHRVFNWKMTYVIIKINHVSCKRQLYPTTDAFCGTLLYPIGPEYTTYSIVSFVQ